MTAEGAEGDTMQQWVALLRGINVGGRRAVGMAQLRALITGELGYDQVRTHLASGNVLFRAAERDEQTVVAVLESALAARFGFAIPVVVRTAAQLRSATDHPFEPVAEAVEHLHVVFLDRVPASPPAEIVDPERFADEAGTLRGRELFLHYRRGAGRSRLTLDHLEALLGVRGTARNLRTVRSLAQLASG